jgi:hypothetical protein
MSKVSVIIRKLTNLCCKGMLHEADKGITFILSMCVLPANNQQGYVPGANNDNKVGVCCLLELLLLHDVHGGAV